MSVTAKAPLRVALAALLGAWALLLSGCSDEPAEPPPNLNAAPPIRQAFVDRMLSFHPAIEAARMESGQIPQGEGVAVLREAGLSNFPAEDPWGGEILYSGAGTEYEISSAGPDKAWGTKDDVRIRNGKPGA